MRRARRGLAAALVFGIAVATLADPSRAASDAGPVCDDFAVTVRTESSETTYRVEIADDGAERAQGLMGRSYMPLDAGMLFIYAEPRPASFWMKNTPLSLDIVYAGPDGRIISVAEGTTPFSTEGIPSGGPVRGVLELNAGQAAARGFGVGDRLVHPAFRTSGPDWTCAAAAAGG